jgi:hypothetical protein
MNQWQRRSFFIWMAIAVIAVLTGITAQTDLDFTLNGNTGSQSSSICIGCMYRIAMTSATEGWAVGEGNYLLHDHGGRWSWVPVPGDGIFLVGVAMSSSDEGWAVGSAILHYHAGTWAVARTMPDNMLLHDVVLTSATAGWAVGEQWQIVNGQQRNTGVIWRYANGSWTQSTTFPDTSLYGVAVVSPDDAWAVGGRWTPGPTANGGIILHYSGGAWTEAGPITDVGLTSIALLPGRDGWIAGSDAEARGLFLRYYAGVWTEVQRLPGVDLRAVAMTSDGDAWAMGQRSDEQSLLLHYTGESWVAVGPPLSQGVGSLALTAPGEGWATGVMTRGQTGYGVLLHVRNATWSTVVLPRQPGGLLFGVPVPIILVLLSLECLLTMALLVLALRAPRTSLWHTWGLRLALVGLICYGLVLEAGLTVGMMRDEYLPDLRVPVASASVLSFGMVIVGLLVLIFTLPRMPAEHEAWFGLRAGRSAPSSAEPDPADDDANTRRGERR